MAQPDRTLAPVIIFVSENANPTEAMIADVQDDKGEGDMGM